MNKLLGTKYPIIQGAMANIADGKFAADVSNAGALGIIATGNMDRLRAREEINICKSLTDKPFGVNLMLMNPNCDDIVEELLEQKVAFVTTGAGNPGKYVDALRSVGTKVIPVVPSVAFANRMERLDIHAIIVEGTEAGGHIGESTTFTLIPQVKDKVNVLVIAAGGIADGRGMLANFVLGASAVQIGTALLVAKECRIHQNYKDLVLKAKDTSTIVTGRSKHAPVRVYKNKMAKKYTDMEKTNIDTLELEKLTLGSLRKAVVEGDIDAGSFMMGQIAGLVNEEKTLEQIFKDIMAGFEEEKKRIADV